MLVGSEMVSEDEVDRAVLNAPSDGVGGRVLEDELESRTVTVMTSVLSFAGGIVGVVRVGSEGFCGGDVVVGRGGGGGGGGEVVGVGVGVRVVVRTGRPGGSSESTIKHARFELGCTTRRSGLNTV